MINLQKDLSMRKLIIADDHQLFRECFVGILKDFHEPLVIQEAGTGRELIEKIESFDPEVVFIDAQMPEMSGYDAAVYITEHYPEIGIIILSMYEDAAVVTKFWELGISGYLSKNTSKEKVFQALDNVIHNNFYINEILVESRKKINGWEVEDQLKMLSGREIKIIKLIGKEKTNNQIAQKMKLSKKSIERIRKQLLKKLNISTTAGLVKFALKHKVI